MFSMSLYESVINGLPIGHYLLSPSAAPIILSVNDTFLRRVSRTRGELVGKKPFDAFPGNPDDLGDTGYGREEDRKDTLIAGFGQHLVKPVGMKTLASVLAEVKRLQSA
jgi:hypothetical protein